MAKIKPSSPGGKGGPGTSKQPSTSGTGGLAPPPMAQTRVPSSADLKKEALHAEVQIVSQLLG